MNIAAVATQVSLEQMQQVYQKSEMGALKGTIESQAMIQQELTAMMRELMPNLGQTIDVSA